MAERHLEIVLDRGGPFREGDRIGGRAVLTSDAAVTVQGGSVSFGWRTRGTGSVDTGTPGIVRDGAAQVEPGVGHVIPFDFVVPPGPVSFAGELVSVEWVVAATVEVPWAIDPTAEAIVEVVAPEGSRLAGDGYRTPPRRAAGEGRAVVGSRHGARALVALGAGLMLIVAAGIQLREGAPWFLVVPFLGLLIAGAVRQGLPWVRNAVARRKLGAPTVELAAATTRGERLPIVVSATPRASIHVEQVTATLSCTETSRKGSGNDTRTQTHLAHADQVVLATAADVTAGATASWSGVLTVPRDAPPTFEATSSSVRWTVAVRVAVAGWPDDEDVHDLTVGP